MKTYSAVTTSGNFPVFRLSLICRTWSPARPLQEGLDVSLLVPEVHPQAVAKVVADLAAKIKLVVADVSVIAMGAGLCG